VDYGGKTSLSRRGTGQGRPSRQWPRAGAPLQIQQWRQHFSSLCASPTRKNSPPSRLFSVPSALDEGQLRRRRRAGKGARRGAESPSTATHTQKRFLSLLLVFFDIKKRRRGGFGGPRELDGRAHRWPTWKINRRMPMPAVERTKRRTPAARRRRRRGSSLSSSPSSRTPHAPLAAELRDPEDALQQVSSPLRGVTNIHTGLSAFFVPGAFVPLQKRFFRTEERREMTAEIGRRRTSARAGWSEIGSNDGSSPLFTARQRSTSAREESLP